MPNPTAKTVRAAVVQAAPVLFDSPATVERVGVLAADAKGQGAELVLFPEVFVGGYPKGLAFGTSVGGRSPEGRKSWGRYHEGAVAVPGPLTHRLGEIAKTNDIHLAIGVVELDEAGGTLYCTLLYFGPNGHLLGKHRKLKPTAAERFIWGEGDGSTLTVIDTPLGKIGGLICWENYMPLARVAMYAKGVEIYLAPTADDRERWQATMRHIALEGRCFVLSANQVYKRESFPADLEVIAELDTWPDQLCHGGSAIYGPLGDCLAGPLWDEEGILIADLDLGEVARGKFDFDVVGHYARPDVFRLEVDERPQEGVRFRI
jgi:nitrilase